VPTPDDPQLKERRPQRSLRAIGGVTLAIAVLIALLSACNSNASTRSGDASAGPTVTAPPATAAASIPPGTVLHVGDQLDYLKTLLRLGNGDQNLPYTVEYSAFVGGPAMLQAFQANAVDIGFVGSTPLIFAQAGQQSIKAVAGWASENGAYGLVTSDPSIKGWADLKGKRVAYQQGTAGEAALLQALDTAGLELSDVTTVNVPTTQIGASLQSNSADAGVSVEPLTSVYLAGNPGGKVVAKASEITDRSSFAIASQTALDDPARAAAIGDFLTRVVKAFKYVNEHRDLLVKAVYVDQYKLTPERAAQVAAENGSTSFVSIPGDVVPAQQRLADLFQANGEVPTKVDVAQEFDVRYNQLIQEAIK
jgi:sulfonate transport system substrate-binding protein